jgi:hypothetical protein
MPHSARIVFLMLAALLLDACASTLNYTEMQALMPPQPADKGRIYFYRETAWLGNLITPDIVLNNKTVGTSNPGAFFFVDREPGDYQVYCGMGEHNGVSFSLAAGQEVYVRTAPDGGIVKATMITETVRPPVAIPEIHSLKYVAMQ